MSYRVNVCHDCFWAVVNVRGLDPEGPSLSLCTAFLYVCHKPLPSSTLHSTCEIPVRAERDHKWKKKRRIALGVPGRLVRLEHYTRPWVSNALGQAYLLSENGIIHGTV